MVAIVAFGVWAGRGNQRIDEFFLAGRRMRWWAVGLSVMATQISAITFVGTTGQAYTDGMRFLVFYFGLPFAMVVLCVTVVPFFYRARVFTAYEYLEKRFDLRTRTLTSLLFLFGRGLSVGVTLYAPSLVMSVILGWGETTTILVMGGSTIVYVIYGGNRSVIWTDVVQMGIIWFGIFLCLGVAIVQLPEHFGLRDALALAQTTGRLRVMDPSPSLTAPYTLWSGLVGGFFIMLSYFGCDQSQVQRYLSGSSLTQSRLSLLFNAFLKVPMQFLILLTGVLVFVFYHFHTPPLLWNVVEMRKLEAAAPPELPAVRSRYEAALAARTEAAQAFGRGARPSAAATYLAANREVEAARKQAIALVETVNGGSVTTTPTTSSVVRPRQHARRPRRPVIAVIRRRHVHPVRRVQLPRHRDDDRFLQAVRPPTAATPTTSSSPSDRGVGGLRPVALQAGRFGSAIETVNRFGSYVYGPILGIFALAVLTPSASGRGAFWGGLAGEAVVCWLVLRSPVHFLWYTLIGAAAVFVVGLAISAAAPPATT
jgi:Na+/proline symporter